MDNNSTTNETPQPQYEQQMLYEVEKEEPVSFGEWMILMLIMLIPCVNIIMLFVWAFSKTEKKSKSNYCKAALIWMAISSVFAIIAFIVMGASMVAVLGM